MRSIWIVCILLACIIFVLFSIFLRMYPADFAHWCTAAVADLFIVFADIVALRTDYFVT